MLAVVVTVQVLLLIPGFTVTHLLHYPIVWTVKRSVVGTRVLAVLYRGLLWHVTLNSNIHSILWSDSTGFVHVTNFPIGGEIMCQLFLNHPTVATEQM